MAYTDSTNDLIINKLSKTKYDALVASNSINANELYFITDDVYYTSAEIDAKGFLTSSDLSTYATKDYVDSTFQAKGEYLTKATADTFYLTSSDLDGYAKSNDLATVATSGSYDDLSNKPTIPNIVYSETEPDSPTTGMIWLKPVSE